MSENSNIAWTDHTFNLAWGCIEASDGCDNCYARVLAKRYGVGWGKDAERRTMSDAYWKQPLKWDRAAEKAGMKARVFSSSMTDVFLNDPVINREREKLWPVIDATPNLQWQLLTKHPERISLNLPGCSGSNCEVILDRNRDVAAYFDGKSVLVDLDEYRQVRKNVWLGVSVENAAVMHRIDALRKVPAIARFLSIEPLIGRIPSLDLNGIGWVIVGGESGPGHRVMDMSWLGEIAGRCFAYNVPLFIKQDSGLRPGKQGRIPDELWAYKEFPR